MAKELDLPVEHVAYYPDVHFFIPDARWGLQYMPSCPRCATNKDVGPHAFQHHHFGRLVVGLHENYYAISRRYQCRCCKEEKNKLKQSVQNFAENSQVEVSIIKFNFNYTFMGWDEGPLPLPADGKGGSFPAFFAHKAGVSKELIDLMRPLFDCGVRPNRLSEILLELHSKRHTRLHLD